MKKNLLFALLITGALFVDIFSNDITIKNQSSSDIQINAKFNLAAKQKSASSKCEDQEKSIKNGESLKIHTDASCCINSINFKGINGALKDKTHSVSTPKGKGCNYNFTVKEDKGAFKVKIEKVFFD